MSKKPVFKIPAAGLPAFTDTNNVTTGQGRLEHQMFHRDQSWCYEAIWALCGRKIRVMVTRNAYDAQSFCKVQTYGEDPGTWNYLCDLPFNKDRHCYKVNYTSEIVDQPLFEQDADDVLEKACRILNPFYAKIVEGAEASDLGKTPAPTVPPAQITKIELIARIYFSDGVVVDRPVDRT